MVEGVSLVASVITVAAAVTQGVKCAKVCSQASEELRTVQASTVASSLFWCWQFKSRYLLSDAP